ncbi:hypothetical protein RFI_07669, partial [Reticulomyxa filosa]
GEIVMTYVSIPVGIALLVLNTIFCWTLASIALYWLHEANKLRWLPVIGNRYYIMAFWTNICLLLASYTHFFFVFLFFVLFWICEIDNDDNVLYAIGYTYRIKTTFRYYNTHYNIALSQGRWVACLNQNALRIGDYGQMQWFVRTSNKNTLGSPTWMFSHICLPFFVFVLILLELAPIISDFVSRAASIIIFAMYVITVAILWMKMPAYVDYIHLKREERTLLFWCLFQLVSYIVYTITLTIDSKDRYFPYLVYVCIFNICFAMFDCGYIVTSTRQVLVWNDLVSILHDYKKARRVASIESSEKSTQHSLSVRYEQSRKRKAKILLTKLDHTFNQNHDQVHDNAGEHVVISNETAAMSDASSRALTLRQILSQKRTLEVFIQFAFGEFAHDNILGIIELTQFKEMMSKKQPGSEDRPSLITLPSDIVKSQIVFDDAKTDLEKFQMLVEKFILNNATFCLNIPYEQRAKLIAAYENRQPASEEMVTIFDDCIIELFDLIGDCFSRFRTTDMYIQLCNTNS